MKAILYDDKRSYLHTILGFLTPLHPFLAVLFLVYEIIEYYVVKEPEDFQHTLGDLCEFSLGIFLWELFVCLFNIL